MMDGETKQRWTDERGLPLVWGLSTPSGGFRSTCHTSEADVLVVALEPVLDLLARTPVPHAYRGPLEGRKTNHARDCERCEIDALLKAHGRLDAT